MIRPKNPMSVNWHYGKKLSQAEVKKRLAAKAAGFKETLGSGSCWCGKPYGHDWPGRDDGKPHPK